MVGPLWRSRHRWALATLETPRRRPRHGPHLGRLYRRTEVSTPRTTTKFPAQGPGIIEAVQIPRRWPHSPGLSLLRSPHHYGFRCLGPSGPQADLQTREGYFIIASSATRVARRHDKKNSAALTSGCAAFFGLPTTAMPANTISLVKKKQHKLFCRRRAFTS